ncbi:MAG: hypothetical protein H0T42_34715 [Deltaproteobacteria bacterium]|nr:hypothetical protein [Deltaproteobacteria bacterium]
MDEHDRAVGAILIGESLMVQCERSADQIRDPHDPQRWRAMREIQDDYPEIWRQLDRAREVLAARGANTMAYEEMRPHVRRTIASDTDDHASTVDADALEDARRAIAELKLAVPGADWKAIARRTRELVAIPELRRHSRFAVVGIVSFVTLAVLTWFLSSIPDKKIDERELMRQELADVASQRKVKIQYLQLAIGERCDAPVAQEYVKLLVMDGQGDHAERFADRYVGRCGEDTVVENWANAPRPPR